MSPAGRDVLERPVAVACQRDAPELALGQLLERAGDVDHVDIGNDVEGNPTPPSPACRFRVANGGPGRRPPSRRRPRRCAGSRRCSGGRISGRGSRRCAGCRTGASRTSSRSRRGRCSQLSATPWCTAPAGRSFVTVSPSTISWRTRPSSFTADLFRRASGQHRALDLARRIGERGADGMQAEEPESVARLGGRPGIGLGIEMAAVVPGHAGLIEIGSRDTTERRSLRFLLQMLHM